MCNNNCIASILEKILILQQSSDPIENGCNKPFLGEIATTSFNTRPINLYSCCSNTLWTMPYNYNGTTGTSTVFRIENINDNCATFRILINDEGTISATDNFFVIDLDYVSCIKCLQDTLVTNL